MKLLDLCAGIGGFSLAAHWMGWQTAAFCEIDKFCQKVLAKNFPGVPIYDDVYTFPAESFRGQVGILSSGFPCQPFSQAGKRKGTDDARHLFPQILKIVATVRPTFCVFENVRGLLSIESGQVFADVISSLESEGYEVITFCIPASAVGAPHRRDRLWIIANLADAKIGGLERGGILHRNYNSENGNGRSEFTRSVSDITGDTYSEHGKEYFGRNQLQETGGKIPSRWNFSSAGHFGNWLEAATALCRVDDGIPGQLDESGRVPAKSKTAAGRAHRLKALGNSIVPQIAYEIFKAIEATG